MLGFAAVNTGNNLLFLVVSGLLAFMAVTGLAGMYNLKGLQPELIPPAELFADSAALARLRLVNAKKRFPSFLISVTCCGQSALFPVVPSGSSTDSSLSLRFSHRGLVPVGRITISSPFPVNFFVRYWNFNSSCEVVVYPRLLPSSGVAAGAERYPIGSRIDHGRGHDGELERISPYSGREPLRSIHWKHSARGADLLVKEFGSQTAPPVIIDPDDLPGSDLEERLSRAAWLVRRLGAQRPVGLRLDGRTIPPATGSGHCTHLLRELALYGLD